MSVILEPNNTYKLRFQHGNLMVTTPPQPYTVLSDNNIKVDVAYGSYIAYVAMENFKYDFDNLNEFAQQIENIIKRQLAEPNTVAETEPVAETETEPTTEPISTTNSG
jgi:hypothetical protein